MKELISIVDREFSGQQANSVDARQLYEFLGSKQHFADWIKSRVLKNSFFMQGVDFIIFHNSMKNQNGGRARKDYALTTDTAKKVSMMESTEAGDKARDYFLQCEKIAKGEIQNPELAGSKQEALELEMIAAKYAADILRVSDNSRLEMMHIVYTSNNVPVLALPQYIEKARAVCSATDLLKKNNCNLNVRAFNKLLVETIYAETKTRLGKGGVTKYYKALTEEGLKYGQNDSYRGSATQTQIHLYEDTFMDLYEVVCGK